jgi:hypothetical protein
MMAPGTKEVTLTCCEHWPVGTSVGADKLEPLSPLIGYLWLMVIWLRAAEQVRRTNQTSGKTRVKIEAVRRLNIHVLLAGEGCSIG